MPKNILIIKHRKFFDSFVFYLESEKVPQVQYPIYVSDGPNKIEEYIYVNTEQMTRKKELERIVKLYKKNKPQEFWDYSVANCKILESHGIHAKHFPLSSPQWPQTARSHKHLLRPSLPFLLPPPLPLARVQEALSMFDRRTPEAITSESWTASS